MAVLITGFLGRLVSNVVIPSAAKAIDSFQQEFARLGGLRERGEAVQALLFSYRTLNDVKEIRTSRFVVFAPFSDPDSPD